MADGEYHVKSIAQTIDDIHDGDMYYCPCCGGWYNMEAVEIKDLEDEDGVPCCPDCESDEALELVGFADYFNDGIYNIEYRAPSKHDDITSVSVMVACGGPNIYIDTADCKVKLYWWMDYAEAEFSRGAGDEITDYFNEIWNCE